MVAKRIYSKQLSKTARLIHEKEKRKAAFREEVDRIRFHNYIDPSKLVRS